MLVTYDTVQTKGLRADDLVEALSARYGPADKPQTSIVIPGYPTYNDNEQVLARWENELYSYNLFRSSYGASFGLVSFSKRLELLASAVSREAERLDRLEAPAHETERLKKQEEDDKALQEKARLISKPNFPRSCSDPLTIRVQRRLVLGFIFHRVPGIKGGGVSSCTSMK